MPGRAGRSALVRWGAATGPPSPPRSETPRQSRGAPRSRFLHCGTAPSLRHDHVTLDRVDLDALVLEPLHPALERAFVPFELERHPAVIGLDVGAPDVDHDVEVLDEPVDDRLLDERRREREADTHAGHREHRARLPSSDRGNDRDLVAVLQRRLLGLEEPDVLLVDVDIDEAAQLSGLVEEAVLQARVLPLEVSDEAIDRLALGLEPGAALREGAQWRGNPDARRHSRLLPRPGWL